MSVATSISVNSALALFTAMAVLAIVPSASVFAVSAKSASSGIKHGALTVAGIVLGDIVFILLAIYGLSLLVQRLGAAFVIVKYAGGAYLLWLSIAIWRFKNQQGQHPTSNKSSHLSSFMMGLLITLGDQKAVLFYLGFLPAFLDLTTLTVLDVAVIVGVTIVAVGGVKLVYVFAADKASQVLGGGFSEFMNILSSVVMFAAGVWVIARA